MAEAVERTLVLVKPDGVQRGLVGAIISRLEARGLKLVGMKMAHISQELAHRHYEAHQNRPFFQGLVQFITSSPVVAMVWQGPNVVDMVRETMGATDPLKAAPGTIRGDLAQNIGRNLVHGSDSAEAARREIGLFFHPNEIVDYPRELEPWIREP